MDCYVIYPCADPVRGHSCALKWKAQGYSVAVQFAAITDISESDAFDFRLYDKYAGYWHALNNLSRAVFAGNVTGNDNPTVCVAIGDDMDPDPNHSAQEIAAAYFSRFPDGFGIMQPCGDKQGELIAGKWNSARICGSPWFGRGWFERAYGGKGPMPTFYRQFYGDEELKEVAETLGVLWHAEEFQQDHKHWAFGRQSITAYQQANQAYWKQDAETFAVRKAQGFPGSKPLAKASQPSKEIQRLLGGNVP